MSHRPFKERIYPEFARIAAALASDRRLEVIDILAQGPRHVEALAEETELSVANVSQHLQILRRARLVETEREGTRVVYRLADDRVLELWLALRSLAESRLADVGELRREFAVPGAEGSELPRDELQRLITRKAAFVIDVRPAVEFQHGHLPGAVSVPVAELPQHLESLPRDKPIVAYCRGAYCLFADEAVALLRSHGFDAHRLEGGWPEWRVEKRQVAI